MGSASLYSQKPEIPQNCSAALHMSSKNTFGFFEKQLEKHYHIPLTYIRKSQNVKIC
jgi:hypothetical protein